MIITIIIKILKFQYDISHFNQVEMLTNITNLFSI